MDWLNFGNNMSQGNMSPVDPLGGTGIRTMFPSTSAVGSNNMVTPLTNSTNGWNTFSNILGGISGLANAFTGFKQLGLAKDQFKWQKDAFNTNLVNQANLVNSQLADRQRRRQFFDSSAASPEEYVAKYGAASSVGEAKDKQTQNQNAWNSSKALNNVKVGG